MPKKKPPSAKCLGTLPKQESTPHTKKFLGQDPWDSVYPWKEWQIQAYIATQASRHGLLFSAGMEGAYKNGSTAARSQATGQQAGEPDMRFYFSDGRLALVELKCVGGVLTASQKERFPKLWAVGFPVEVVYCPSPAKGWELVYGYLKNFMEDCGNAGF